MKIISRYCCVNGKSIKSSELNCKQQRGHFFLNRNNVKKKCDALSGYCCKEGTVFGDDDEEDEEYVDLFGDVEDDDSDSDDSDTSENGDGNDTGAVDNKTTVQIIHFSLTAVQPLQQFPCIQVDIHL